MERAGSKTREDIDGKRRNGKRIMARALWELATTGHATLPREDGSKYQIVVGGDGWFDVVKWLYQHIDGPPKLRTEVSGPGGESLTRGLEAALDRAFDRQVPDEQT